jgi:hypothetical protein
MLLPIGDWPLPLLCSVAKIICLGNRTTYSVTHGLRESRIRFIAIIDHKEMPRERGPTMKDPSLLM